MNTAVGHRIQGRSLVVYTGETVGGIESRNDHGNPIATRLAGLNERSFTSGVVQEEKRFS
jgi:hypothetical protein